MLEPERWRTERAELLERERAARAAADAALRRVRFFAETSMVLASSLDYDATLQHIARSAVPFLCDWCVVETLDADQTLRLAAVAHVNPAKETLARELQARLAPRPDELPLLASAVRTGEAVLTPVLSAADLEREVRNPRQRELVQAIGPRSSIVAPLKSRDQTLGFIACAITESDRRYGPDDLALVEEIARLAALAIVNARVYQEARAAIRRQEESLALLDALLACAPIGTAFLDRSLRYIRVNQMLERLTGVPSAARIGRTVREVLPDLAPKIEPLLRSVLATRQPIVGQEVSGSVPEWREQQRHWLVSFCPVEAPDGELLGIGVAVMDITDHKQSEEEHERLLFELESERSRLEAVLRQMPAGVIIAEAPSGRLVLGNEQVERIWRHPFLPAASIEEYERYRGFHSDGRSLAPEEWPLARSITTGETVVAEEIDFLRGDGVLGTMEVNSAPIRERDGRIVAGVVTFTDVTERKQAEAEQRFLAEASRELTSSLDYETTLANVARLAVPILADICLINVVNPDGSLRRVAAAHPDPEMDRQLQKLRTYPPATSAHPVLRALETGQTQHVAELNDALFVAIAQGPEHLALLRSIGYRSGLYVPLSGRGRTLGVIELLMARSGRCHGPREILLGEELARRAGLAVDNARLYREAQAAIRLRDDFLSVAAHELKTPITGLRGYAQLLLRQIDRDGMVSPERLAYALRIIDQQSVKLTRLLNHLLDVSRLEAGKLAVERSGTDLVALVEGVLAIARATASRHSIELRAPPRVLALVDPIRLEQVLSNLLDNAIKYSPAGGRIEVEIAAAESGGVQLSVRDRGLGISPEHREHIFDRFYQAHNTEHASGLGLGLYVSRQIVLLHGGDLQAEFPEDGGTRMVLTLPANLPPLPPSR